MPTDLEKQFRDEMLRTCDRTVAEATYRPTQFRNMVAANGGLSADPRSQARRGLSTSKPKWLALRVRRLNSEKSAVTGDQQERTKSE
jgi:hypothetical protein